MTEQVEQTQEVKAVPKEKNVVELIHPFEVDGEKIKKIKLNLEEMTGKDILKIDKELKLSGRVGGLDTFWDQSVLIHIASKACGILVDDLLTLKGEDFVEMTFQVRLFFVGK